MSTNATIPSPETVTALPVKSETLSYAIVVFLDAAEKPEKYALNAATSKLVETIKANTNAAEPKDTVIEGKKVLLVNEITVTKPIVGTLAGFEELYPSEADRLFIINKGIDTYFNARVRANLLETDDANNLTFQFTDGNIDGTPFVQEIANPRVKQSQEEKAIAALKKVPGFDEGMIAAIMAQIKANASSQSAPSV